MQGRKTARQMERHLKGIANHRRIQILLYIAKHDNCTLEDIISALDANEKTVGEHARRLAQAGLVKKQYRGRNVEHTLTPYGKLFVHFLLKFEQQ